MKSIDDINVAIVALSKLACNGEDKEVEKAAKNCAKMLCWVAGYENSFESTFRAMKHLYFDLAKFTPEELQKIINKSVAEVNADSGETKVE